MARRGGLPRCGDDSDVWLFVKPEGPVEKECYTCEACGLEWSENSATLIRSARLIGS